MKFQRLSSAEKAQFEPGIVALEQTATYPLGNDFFQLDHGENYFAFFERLGEMNYYLAWDELAAKQTLENKGVQPISQSLTVQAQAPTQPESARKPSIAAVGAGILRQISYQQSQTPQTAWYLCDLKVHPDYQRQHLSLRLLHHAIRDGIQHCNRGYLISMNPDGGQPNRLVKVLEKLPLIQFRCSTTLGIYSLEADAIAQIASALEDHRGPISYLSLQGIKDLRLQSNGKILPLLHVQWGNAGEATHPQPIPGYTHMFCVPAGDPLAQTLARQDVYPTATASVVSHGMEQSDWRFILTSDI